MRALALPLALAPVLALAPALALLLARCDAVPPLHRPAICMVHPGTYSEVFTESSGSCGALPDQVFVVDANARDAGTECSGAQHQPSACTLIVEKTCPAAPGYLLSTKGRVQWSTDGRTGKGTLELRWFSSSSNADVCSSTYDVTLTRL